MYLAVRPSPATTRVNVAITLPVSVRMSSNFDRGDAALSHAYAVEFYDPFQGCNAVVSWR